MKFTNGMLVAAAVLLAVALAPLLNSPDTRPSGSDAPSAVVSPDQDSKAIAHSHAHEKKKVRKAAQQRARSAAPGALGHRTGHHSHAKQLPGAHWNPCAAIEVLYNPQNAPKGAVRDLKLAIRKTAAASGLNIKVLGTTTVNPTRDYHMVAGRPVLVSWGKPGHGVLNEGAGATTVTAAWPVSGNGYVYRSAQITFSTVLDDLYTPGFGKRGSRVAMMMHELGHLVGLDHVSDRKQLMFSDALLNRDFGSGDMNGLKLTKAPTCL